MAKVEHTSDARVLVGIDISKHRHEVLIAVPGKTRRRRMTIFSRGPGGHVGFALGQDDAHFYVLGGNQSDAVTIARIAKSHLLGALARDLSTPPAAPADHETGRISGNHQ